MPIRSLCLIAGISLVGFVPAYGQSLKLGDVEIGGAVRLNFWKKSWERTSDRPIDELEVDTVRLRAEYERGSVFGSAQYRYYIYGDGRSDSHFPHHAYIGWRPEEGRELTAGIQQVPFGLLPFAGNSYFSTIAYYVGLEDDYDLGVKYRDRRGKWDWALAYYPSDEGSYVGESVDSARYSYDVVQTPTSGNDESHQVNTRLARRFETGAWTGEVGASLQYGLIPNDLTGRDGDHKAAALHLSASRGPFTLKAQSSVYEYDLETPEGVDDRVVPMGAYDYDYNVAAAGAIHSLALSYAWEADMVPLVETVTFYNDYSLLAKQEEEFGDTQHNVLGAAVDVRGPLFVYVDAAFGQHNAWIGSNFGDALATGQGEDAWEHRFNINVGAYF